jgi:hypothetical protein
MKKTKTNELRREYRREELGPGIRGKHYADFMAGTNLVLLKPDIAAVFPTAEAVDAALRSLIPGPKRAGVTRKKSVLRARNSRP